MYSVKPGRGPSLMGGVAGIIAAVFGVIWTAGAASMGAPGFFVLFGFVFVAAALGGALYNFYNATQKNRLSHFDVMADVDEPDPLAQAMGHAPRENCVKPSAGQTRQFQGEFCPFCGTRVRADFDYCPKCGKDI